MSQQVIVYSVEALEELRVALLLYHDHALRTLEAANLEIRRTYEWLTERQQFWRNEVRRRSELVQQAMIIFNACKTHTTYDAKTGRSNRPDCEREWQAVEKAKRFQAAAEHELQIVNKVLQQMQLADERYQRAAQRLTALLNNDLPQSAVFLKRKIALLHSTLGGSSLSGSGVDLTATTDVAASRLDVADGDRIYPSAQSTTAPGEWTERGIQLAPLAQIDLSDSYVQGPTDYKKVAYDIMVEGVHKLADVVLPAVGNGANADYFDELDRQNGVAYTDGYRRVYDAFYGSDPIRLEKSEGGYKVIGGYHRLLIAKHLGLPEIPASVVEKV